MFPPKSEGATLDEAGNIHLEISPPEPQVWFLDKAFEWHFLAANFPTYFRMMLVHLGLPLWQMRFTSMGLPQVQSGENIFNNKTNNCQKIRRVHNN